MAVQENSNSARETVAKATADEAGAQCQNANEITIATYDQIAPFYYDDWRDRSAIQHHLTRFADMLRAYGLSALPVIDVGCGPGFDAAVFRQSGLRAIGLDLSLAMMNAGRPEFGGDYILADMRQLPLASGVGGLWVGASLLHLPRDEVPAVLRGFASTLTAGGLLYLSVKAGRGAEWTAESHGQPLPRYFVYWQPRALDQVLCAAGFEIVEGSLSPAGQATRWLIRFARKAPAGHLRL